MHYTEKFITLLEEIVDQKTSIPVTFAEDMQKALSPYMQNRANGIDRIIAVKNKIRNLSTNPSEAEIKTRKKFNFTAEDFGEKKKMPTIVPPVDTPIVGEVTKIETTNHDKILDIYTGELAKAKANFKTVKDFIDHCAKLEIVIDPAKNKTMESAYKVFHAAAKKILGF